MTKEEKSFLKNWEQYRGNKKWLFIAFWGSIVSVSIYLITSALNFLLTETITWNNIKLYFINTGFLVGMLINILTIGFICGFAMWKMSDIHYRSLIENMQANEHSDIE